MENLSNKARAILIAIGLLVIGFIMLVFASYITVEPGEEGFIYRPWSGGMDTSQVYTNGAHIIWPWDKMIIYDMREQSKDYNSEVLDKNGLPVKISAAVNYKIMTGQSLKIHLEYGVNYQVKLVDKKTRGAIKDVVGKFSAEELYSTKRDVLETEIETILTEAFTSENVELSFVEIADVDLPASIQKGIENKEVQEQRNLLAKKKKLEATYLADAKIETARGDSTKKVIEAAAEAQSIEMIQEQIALSPQYIQYRQIERWDGSIGTGNVFSGEGVNLFKNIGK